MKVKYNVVLDLLQKKIEIQYCKKLSHCFVKNEMIEKSVFMFHSFFNKLYFFFAV